VYEPDRLSGLPTDRARIGWWLFVLGLGLVAAYIATQFVGMLVLGVFGYYAMRPICGRIESRVDSPRLAGALTVLLVLVPIILLLAYLVVRAVTRAQELLSGSPSATLIYQVNSFDRLSSSQQEQIRALIRNPTSALSGQTGSFFSHTELAMQVMQAVMGTVLLVGLAAAIAYVLLVRDSTFSDVLVTLVGGRDTTAYAYAAAVDEDLESVFFGNLLFASIMAVVATVTYATTNVLAPEGVQIPMVLVLGFLTGAASLIPIVVGKVVYVPVVLYLGVQALRSGGGSLTFVGLVVVAYVVVLDLLPQSLIQPYVTGRQLDMMLLLFAYVLGPMVWGWYGFFLLPIVFILLLEAVRIVIPELIHGDSLDPSVAFETNTGTDPTRERDDVPDVDDSSSPDSEGSSESSDSSSTGGAAPGSS
jgi:predicted PurR-regulated permease PerM